MHNLIELETDHIARALVCLQAEQLREILTQLGPAFVKIGQVALARPPKAATQHLTEQSVTHAYLTGARLSSHLPYSASEAEHVLQRYVLWHLHAPGLQEERREQR